MENLNAEQRDAVQTIEGPLLILAGAGSGKTRVITYRIAHLIREAGVPPWQILAVTFTNKAAGEMKARVEALLQSERLASSPLISTFHSLCVRILRRDIARLEAGYTRDFTIYDGDDQARVVRGIMKDLSYDDKTITPRAALSAISWAKNRRLSPAAYLNHFEFTNDRTERIARIFKVYDDRLQKSNALDFDDLLIKTVDLLRRDADVRAQYHNKFHHVMIDEFQDTNGIQYELARLIAVGSVNPEQAIEDAQTLWQGRSLCVVGDIDQAVYSFRGSDFNIILGFQHDFAGTKIIKLEQNYRSTQTILEAANQVIEHNQQRLPKTLYATKSLGQGEKIRYYQSYDGEGEASFVAERIQDHLRRAPSTRCAILYRTNAQSRLFEESLRRRGVAYNIVGGFSFYERAEVKDIIAYLKLALNPNDDVALFRVINTPPRGIGKTTIDALLRQQKDLDVSLWETLGIAVEQRMLGGRATASLDVFRQIIISLGERTESEQPLSETVKAATFETGYARWLQEEKSEEAEARLLNIEELGAAAFEAEKQGESLRDFIDHAALVSDTDQYKEDARVTLMTMHAAKGLEFPIVFLVGMEDGLFPSLRGIVPSDFNSDSTTEYPEPYDEQSKERLEEERRLCYVAITRAQQQLYLTNAMRRRRFYAEKAAGGSRFFDEAETRVSRFLKEIPDDLLEDISAGPSWLKFSRRPDTRHNRDAREALRGISYSTQKTGATDKSNNSLDNVYEFLERMKGRAPSANRVSAPSREEAESPRAKSEGGKFRVGARVRHAKFGAGSVLGVEGAGDDAKITVRFDTHGIKKFVARYSKNDWR